MNLHLLYPGNPLRRSEPDELYAEEYAAAVELGFQASLFPFEEFLTGDFRARPSLRPGQRILYRGWMLTPQQYSRLHAEIVATGAEKLDPGWCRWPSRMQEDTAGGNESFRLPW